MSVGGSCSYSRSYPVRRSRPKIQYTSPTSASAGRSANAASTPSARSGWFFQSSMRSWSCWNASASASSSATIVSSPFPRATRMPAVEENARRGTSVRSSTNWRAGTDTARSVARRPASSTSPRTQTGFPQPLRILAGAFSAATRRASGSSHWSPQTFRFTSTTSSYATATPRSVYETVNARVSFVASKYQTMRTPSSVRSRPKVRSGPGSSSVFVPCVYATPRSATEGSTSVSPSRRGMSR